MMTKELNLRKLINKYCGFCDRIRFIAKYAFSDLIPANNPFADVTLFPIKSSETTARVDNVYHKGIFLRKCQLIIEGYDTQNCFPNGEHRKYGIIFNLESYMGKNKLIQALSGADAITFKDGIIVVTKDNKAYVVNSTVIVSIDKGASRIKGGAIWDFQYSFTKNAEQVVFAEPLKF